MAGLVIKRSVASDLIVRSWRSDEIRSHDTAAHDLIQGFELFIVDARSRSLLRVERNDTQRDAARSLSHNCVRNIPSLFPPFIMPESSTKPSPADPVASPVATEPSESTSQQPTTAPSDNADAEKEWPDESDPWFGHLHHLSEEQENALNAFRKVCAEKGLYRYAVSAEEGGDKEEGEEGAEGPKDASHDDATLLYDSLMSIQVADQANVNILK